MGLENERFPSVLPLARRSPPLVWVIEVEKFPAANLRLWNARPPRRHKKGNKIEACTASLVCSQSASGCRPASLCPGSSSTVSCCCHGGRDPPRGLASITSSCSLQGRQEPSSERGSFPLGFHLTWILFCHWISFYYLFLWYQLSLNFSSHLCWGWQDDRTSLLFCENKFFFFFSSS